VIVCPCGAVRPAPITGPCEHCTGNGNHGTPIVVRTIHNPRTARDAWSI